MTRTVYPGGWYADSTPAGSFVVLFPQSHLLTHLGRVELPPAEPWGVGFVRCTDVDGFRFAGQAHSTLNPACWQASVWDNAGVYWEPLPPPCFGVSPCIYDLDGVLHRSDGSVGSQGYRYVAAHGTPAGTIISGDATYRYPTGQLYEYSAAGDLWIGQAAYDGGGVQVLTPDGVLRQLELGDGRFIRVQVDGERVSLAWMASIGAVIIQTTLAELRALPPVVTPQPPDPTPVPPDPPVPHPEPPEPPKPIPPQPPVLPYPRITGVPMQTERGWLIGPGDKAVATHPDGTVTFERTDLTDADLLQAEPQADGRCVVRSVPVGSILGADATKYSPVGVCGQYYAVTNAPGNYELWSFGHWPSGIVTAVVEYTSQGADHGRHWQAAGLTWVRQA